MKKMMIVAAVMGLATAIVQAEIINVNLSSLKASTGQNLNGSSASMPTNYTGTTWNDSLKTTSMTDMLDTDGNPTTVDFALSGVTDKFWFSSAIGLDVLKEYRYMSGSAGSPSVTITLTGLGANGQWDIYLLSQGDANGRTTRFGLGSGSLAANSTIAKNDNSNPLIQDASPADYTATTWTENGNYVKFSATADASGTLVIEAASLSGGNNGSLNGMQLVAIPEPATLGLIGMVSVGLIVVRRFRM